MNVAILGTGYVGLVAGACFAETGNRVICLDLLESKIEALKNGRIPIYEPGLKDLVHRNAQAGRLEFTTDVAHAVRSSEIIFIAVGTPQDEDGSADLRHVLAAAESIATNMNGPKIVVDKSTVPVGTADKVRERIQSLTHHAVSVVSNPEFLKEGNAIEDFMKPDRVVIGADDEETRNAMQELYSPFMRTGKPILFMDPKSAELTKYAANALLATKISFMNEIANLCELVGADVSKVREGVGSDCRIGPHFLFPGIGYGGSCFPKDISALRKTASDFGSPSKILGAVDAVNADQKKVLVKKAIRCLGDLAGRRIAIWGLSFKPRTDDMREAPALTVVREFLEAGVTVVVHDPEAMEEARRHFGDRVEYATDMYAALSGADALCILTEWQNYSNPDLEMVRGLLKRPLILDGRNLYSLSRMRKLKFEYHSIGRMPVMEGNA